MPFKMIVGEIDIRKTVSPLFVCAFFASEGDI